MLHDLFQVLPLIALVLALILTPLLYPPLSHILRLLLLCSCRRVIVAGRA
jgi:hypothetical protein